MMKAHADQNGFTLIEVLVALTVLAIGFLGTVTMMTGTTGNNATASSLTGAAAVASKQMELLMGLPYNDALLQDDPGGTGLFLGTAGLRNPLSASDIPDPANFPADYQATSADGDYTIYWNVAVGSPTTGTKTIQVIVTSTGRGVQKTVSLESIKPEII